ncbi:hypothetical protein [Pontibacter litorisediminis]|uniref:hypothetical protein n=1 Tax=Pontibacter litorisediminis TaxID=1846260 RepID=UPI0023ED750D|nr:hypothetical protein [Pontibacter litorisediminis]
MLHLSKQLSKLIGSLLLLALLTACESDESTTEFAGKVVDPDTNQPVADAKVALIIGDGLAPGGSFVAPEEMNGSTNSKGEYKFLKSYRQGQTVYWVTPEKAGYVEVKDAIGKELKPNERNVLDIQLAKASYLNLSINKTSAATPHKALKITLSYPMDASASPVTGMMYSAEIITYDATAAATELLRGYYFKRTPFVLLEWEVTTDGATETKNVKVPLVEYDTTYYEINY